MKYTSKILQETVDAFSSLPGIGRKSAMRIALHLANKGRQRIMNFSQTLMMLSEGLKTCKTCYAYADEEQCSICSNPSRNHKVICVVESIRDLMAIEETQQFSGVYHVLNGLISPVDGIGPDQLMSKKIEVLLLRNEVDEIIIIVRIIEQITVV